jgi:hypothetical protein
MTADVWIGALLSIPIGVGTSLLVPSIQRWLDARGNKKTLAETKRVRAEYEEVLYYQKNPIVFTQYLAQVAVKTTFIGALVSIFANLLSALANAFNLVSVYRLESLLFFASQIIFVVSSVLIVNISRPAMRLWARIRYFDTYSKTVPDEIRGSVERPDAALSVSK